MTLQVLIHGIGGRMGKHLLEVIAKTENVSVIAGVDAYANPTAFSVPVYKSLSDVKEKADVLIDFSVKDAVPNVIAYCVETKTPAVICTTGLNDAMVEDLKEASKTIPVFRSGNMSIGINLLMRLVYEAAEALGEAADVEIIETHHNQKVDAPSGTALMLRDSVGKARTLHPVYGREGQVGKRKKDEIGIHAVRGGTVVGKHEVEFLMNGEVITVKHEAESRVIFAEGAVKAALWLYDKPSGLYNMSDVLE